MHFFSKKSLLKIENSHLGKTNFQSLNFKSADSIFIDSSDFSEASIKGEYFPYQLNNQVYSSVDFNNNKLLENTKSRNIPRLADFYNDLANMMKNQGNKRRELAYLATYQNLLKQSLQQKTTKTLDELFDIFSLWLGNVSSLHTTSWRKALVFILTSSISLFLLYSIIHPGVEFCWFNCSNWDMLGYYFEFLMPTHKFNFIPNPNAFAKAIDFISRIIIGYGIYQLITSFRRLSRR